MAEPAEQQAATGASSSLNNMGNLWQALDDVERSPEGLGQEEKKADLNNLFDKKNYQKFGELRDKLWPNSEYSPVAGAGLPITIIFLLERKETANGEVPETEQFISAMFEQSRDWWVVDVSLATTTPAGQTATSPTKSQSKSCDEWVTSIVEELQPTLWVIASTALKRLSPKLQQKYRENEIDHPSRANTRCDPEGRDGRDRFIRKLAEMSAKAQLHKNVPWDQLCMHEWRRNKPTIKNWGAKVLNELRERCVAGQEVVLDDLYGDMCPTFWFDYWNEQSHSDRKSRFNNWLKKDYSEEFEVCGTRATKYRLKAL